MAQPMDPSSVYKPFFFSEFKVFISFFKSGFVSQPPIPQPKQTTLLSTVQAAVWLILTLVSEFQVPNSDIFGHFWQLK
jgi:hypothetical protein